MEIEHPYDFHHNMHIYVDVTSPCGITVER